MVVDSDFGVDAMILAAEKHGVSIDLFLKVDVGLGRVGVRENDPGLLGIVNRIVEHPKLRFIGLLSHAGQVG